MPQRILAGTAVPTALDDFSAAHLREFFKAHPTLDTVEEANIENNLRVLNLIETLDQRFQGKNAVVNELCSLVREFAQQLHERNVRLIELEAALERALGETESPSRRSGG